MSLGNSSLQAPSTLLSTALFLGLQEKCLSKDTSRNKQQIGLLGSFHVTAHCLGRENHLFFSSCSRPAIHAEQRARPCCQDHIEGGFHAGKEVQQPKGSKHQSLRRRKRNVRLSIVQWKGKCLRTKQLCTCTFCHQTVKSGRFQAELLWLTDTGNSKHTQRRKETQSDLNSVLNLKSQNLPGELHEYAVWVKGNKKKLFFEEFVEDSRGRYESTYL